MKTGTDILYKHGIFLAGLFLVGYCIRLLFSAETAVAGVPSLVSDYGTFIQGACTIVSLLCQAAINRKNPFTAIPLQNQRPVAPKREWKMNLHHLISIKIKTSIRFGPLIVVNTNIVNDSVPKKKKMPNRIGNTRKRSAKPN